MQDTISGIPTAGMGPTLAPAATELALTTGAPLREDPGAPSILPEVLQQAARSGSDGGMVYIQSDGAWVRQSYPALLEEAERILAGLRALGLRPGDKVLFQLNRHQDFIPSFWACILGAFVPVPIATPATYHRHGAAVQKLHLVWEMLDQPLILTSRELHPGVYSLLSQWVSSDRAVPTRSVRVARSLPIAIVEDVRLCPRDRSWHPSQPGELALLMLTSGSTGTPKAVSLSHYNLLSRSAGSIQLNGLSCHDISLNWMPLDHVAGIVKCHLREIYLGCQQIHAPTALVLQQPLRWLDWISEFRVTITFAPNFGYSLVNNCAEEIRRRRWDLSSLRFAMNGGEAIAARTARKFLELLAPHGLSGMAMRPVWGMSETSSGVTGSDRFALASTADTDAFVEVGTPIPGISLRIVDSRDSIVAEGVTGHLQVQGAPVTAGFYQDPKLNAEAFTPDGWYRTGDLGFLREGRLTITGRHKDTIIINGINCHSHDIEAAVEEIPGVQVSNTAACAVRDAGSETDRLAIFFCAPYSDETQLVELIRTIRAKVVQDIGVNPAYLLPLEKEAIPKTEIGKIQRQRLRERFERGEFNASLERIDSAFRSHQGEADRATPQTETERRIGQIWQEVLGVPRAGMDDRFFELGGDSLQGAQVISRLQDTFSMEIPLQPLLEASSVRELSRVLVAHEPRPGYTEMIAHLVSEIEEMSPDEVSALLLKRRQTSAEIHAGSSCSAPSHGNEKRELLGYFVADREGIEVSQRAGIPRREDDGELPLSFAQEQLWFLDQWEPGSQYNCPVAWRLAGPLDLAVLEQSLWEIQRRHEALRTTFPTVHGRPTQAIDPAPDVPLRAVDLAGYAVSERTAEVQRLITADACRRFDLARGPLWRALLVRLATEEHVLLVTVHHIVTDSWSLGLFTRELASFYNAFSSGEPSPLPELPVQYADFAVWQRKWLQGEVLEAQLHYWKQQLASAPVELELPTDRPRPTTRTTHGGHQCLTLSAPLAQRLRAVCRQEGVTLPMLLLAGFQILLHRHARQEDILIGTPVANRSRVELEGLIGFFVNTLVVRGDLSGDPTVQELLQRVRKVALGAYAHQDLPFGKLVENLQPQREANRTPVCQVMFAFQNAPMPPIELTGLTVSPVPVDSRSAQFDLTLSMGETEQGLTARLEYSTDLFEAPTIAQMLRRFQVLLEGIAADPGQPLSRLPLLTEPEKHQLLSEWNARPTEVSDARCLHQLFEARVKQTPDAVAVVYNGARLTYRGLNQRANQLAHYLRKRGVGSGCSRIGRMGEWADGPGACEADGLVGLCLDHSLEMVVAILAVLKAGGAFVPLDPRHPKERLASMIGDARLALLLTQERWVEQLASHHTEIVCLDTSSETIGRESWEDLTAQASAEALAYVIYTSGSTGKPKGVLVSHRALVAHCRAIQQSYELSAIDRVLQFASPCFDASLEQIFPALFAGACLVLRDTEGWAATEFWEKAWRLGLTVANLPPAYWYQVVQEYINAPLAVAEHRLRLVIVGGDVMPPAGLDQWQQAPMQNVRLLNAYGPTEATITTTLFEISSRFCRDVVRGSIPIGRPITGKPVYLLDQRGNLVPIGVVGELTIGGEALAWGYLNQPELTAERFIPDPFSDAPGARLFRTGDLARWRADGNLEFLGRLDNQVKLRGFRIELGEIEAALSQHPAVRECVVLLREARPGDPCLVAYVVIPDGVQFFDSSRQQGGQGEGRATGSTSSSTSARGSADLRQYLREKLPDYMLPSAFVFLESLPLTPNGKIDRLSLPELITPRREDEPPDARESFGAALSPIEAVLARIWAEVLGPRAFLGGPIGIRDNFFERGGHSLTATQVVSRIRADLEVDIPVRSIFEAPTIKELSTLLLSLACQRAQVEDKAELLQLLEQLSEDERQSPLDAEAIAAAISLSPGVTRTGERG
jgi:polyketide synthase PksJ